MTQAPTRGGRRLYPARASEARQALDRGEDPASRSRRCQIPLRLFGILAALEGFIKPTEMNSVAVNEQADRGLRLRRHRLLHEARKLLTRRVLKLIAFVVFAYLILQLVPGLEKALKNLKGVGWQWIVGAAAIETLSETGYVIS